MPATIPPSSDDYTQYTWVWIPHGHDILVLVIILAWLATWLWFVYFKTLDHRQFCWFCGGEKEKTRCFMGVPHLVGDDRDKWRNDDLVA